MLGHTQMFHRENRLTRKQRKAIDVIHRYSEHLLMLISDIVDFGRPARLIFPLRSGPM